VFAAPDGRGRNHRSTSRAIERAVERAGLEDVSAHTLRHVFASLLIVGLRLDPGRVRRQLGHSDAATTLRAYSLEFEQARHADELRQQLGASFGHLLEVNAKSTGGRNQAQVAPLRSA